MSKLWNNTNGAKRVVLVALPVILFGIIGFGLYAEIAVLFEHWVYYESTEHMSPALTFCVKAVTFFGSPLAVVAVCLALFIIPVTRANYALPASLSAFVAACLSAALKQFFARPRPELLRLTGETNYSFPSGHAMITMALFSAIMLLAWKYMKTHEDRLVTTVPIVALITAVGLSRVYLGAHFITDVVAGWCLGLAVALCVVFTQDAIRTRYLKSQHQKPADDTAE
ncbi:MAG: phosphatase PAP2 family protein [Coriobacteriia bacterium]|nr:phosphatase PAP2 family protein [Coriobacteriia bacterium]